MGPGTIAQGLCAEHSTLALSVPDGRFGRAGRPQPIGHVNGNWAKRTSQSSRVEGDITPSRRRADAKRNAAVRARLLQDDDALERVAVSPLVTVYDHSGEARLSTTAFASSCAYDLLEVRRPPGYKKDPKVSGLFAFQSELGGYHVWYESLTERRNLLDLQWVERPRFLSTQFASLAWYFDGLRIEHFPDILIERPDGSHLVVDVHYRSRTGEEKRVSPIEWCNWPGGPSGPSGHGGRVGPTHGGATA